MTDTLLKSIIYRISLGLLISIPLIVVVLLLAYSWLTQPNYSVYITGCIEAYGDVSRGTASYYSIDVGTPKQPYDGKAVIQVRLADGNEFELPRLSIETIADMAHDTRDAIGGWPEGAIAYQLDSAGVIVLKESILQVRINGRYEQPPQVRNPANPDSEWLTFPLSAEAMEALIGPAERRVDGFHF